MPGKKKGPDPEEERRQLEELQALQREEYQKKYSDLKKQSLRHPRGKVPGFDPHPQERIGDDEVDRLIVRRGPKKANWEDPADDEPIPGAAEASGDPEGQEVQESLRVTQSDLFETLRMVQCEVAGVEGRAEIECPETDTVAVEEAVDGDAVEGGGAGALSEMRHDFYASSGGHGDNDSAAEQAACEALGTTEILLVLWGKRKEVGLGGGLIAELCRHLRVPRGRMTLLQQAIGCRYGEKNPGRTNAELLVLFLYSCEAVEIDRVLQICQGTPAEGYVPQSPSIRMVVDRGLRERDLRSIFDWICFISVLVCTSTRLAADKIGHTLYRPLKGLTQDQVAALKQAKTDELHFLPPLCLFSLDVDAAVGDDYRQPDAAVLTIRGARAGTDLSNVVNQRQDADGVQRGKGGEVMLPPLTCLRVKDIKYEQGLRVTYDYHGALLHPATSGDLPHFRDDARRSFTAYVREIRAHCRKLDGEFRLLQRYQRVYRKLQLHKTTMAKLAEVIVAREAEREAAQSAIEKLPRGAKPPPGMMKPEDVLAALDADKCTFLDAHCQQQRKEQERLERELDALKAGIDGGRDEFTRKETVDSVDGDLKTLLQMQTEQYNQMALIHEKEDKAAEKLIARVERLRPVDTKKKKAKAPPAK